MYKFVETIHVLMCSECGEIHIVDDETFDEMLEDDVIEFECDCDECQEAKAFEAEAIARGYVKA